MATATANMPVSPASLEATTTSSTASTSTSTSQPKSQHQHHPHRRQPRSHVAHRTGSRTSLHTMTALTSTGGAKRNSSSTALGYDSQHRRDHSGGSHTSLSTLGAASDGPKRTASGGSRRRGLDALGLGMTSNTGVANAATVAMARRTSGQGSNEHHWSQQERPRVRRNASSGSQGSLGKGKGKGKGKARTSMGGGKVGKKGAFRGALEAKSEEEEDDEEEEEEEVEMEVEDVVEAEPEIQVVEDPPPRRESSRISIHSGEVAPPPSVPPVDSVLSHNAIPAVRTNILPPTDISPPKPVAAPVVEAAEDEGEWVSEPSTRAPSRAVSVPQTPAATHTGPPPLSKAPPQSAVAPPMKATGSGRQINFRRPTDPSPQGPPRVEMSRERGRSTSRTRAQDEARAQAERESRRSRSRNSGSGFRALTTTSGTVVGKGRDSSDSPAGRGRGLQISGKGPLRSESNDVALRAAHESSVPFAQSGDTDEEDAGPAPSKQAIGRAKGRHMPPPLTLRKAPSSGSLAGGIASSIKSSRSFAGFGALTSPQERHASTKLDTNEVFVNFSAVRSGRSSEEVPRTAARDEQRAREEAAEQLGRAKGGRPTSIVLPAHDPQHAHRRGAAGTLTPSEAAALAERLRHASGSEGGLISPLASTRLRKTSGYFGSLRSLVGLAVPEEDSPEDRPAAEKRVVNGAAGEGGPRGLQRSVTAPHGALGAAGAKTQQPAAQQVKAKRPTPLISKFISPSDLSPPENRTAFGLTPSTPSNMPAGQKPGGAAAALRDETPRRSYSAAGLSRTQQRMLLQRDAPLSPPFDATRAAPSHVIRSLGGQTGPLPMMPLPASGPAPLPQPGQTQLNAPAMRQRSAQMLEMWVGALADEAERVGREHETARRFRDPMAESFARVAMARKSVEQASARSNQSVGGSTYYGSR